MSTQVVTLPEKLIEKRSIVVDGGGHTEDVCVVKALIYHAKVVIGNFSYIACGCSGKNTRLQCLQVSSVSVPTDFGECFADPNLLFFIVSLTHSFI